MSKTTRSIKELLEQADLLPHGPEARARLDQAIALADESGDTKLGYAARLRLIENAHMLGDTETLLTAFGWCVGMNDKDPRKHPAQLEEGSFDLLWYHKWMASRLTTSPVFPLADIEASLDLMERKYREAGVGNSGVIQSRFAFATRIGDLETAKRLRVELQQTPRDEYSHCEACVRSEDADFLYAIGDDAAGLAAFDEVIDGGFSCGEEPESVQSASLLALLRAGRLDDARTHHLASYRMLRSNTDALGGIANHLVFCAITGNEARGLTLLERHLGMLAHDALNASDRFAGLIGVGVLLDAVEAAGHGAIPVRAAGDARLAGVLGEAPADGFTVASLGARVWAAAADLAARFDARNGTDWFAARIRSAKALAGERYDLPIGSDFLGAPATTEPAPTVADPTDAVGWFQRSLALMYLGDSGEAAVALAAGLDADPDPNTLARLIGLQVQLLRDFGTPQETIDELLVTRRAALTDDGRVEQAAAEARFGMAFFGSATDADIEGMLLALEDAVDANLRADILLTAALHLRQTDPEQSLALADRALAEHPTERSVLDSALLATASLRFEAGERDAAIAQLAALVESSETDGVRAAALRSLAGWAGALGDPAGGVPSAERLLDIAMAAGSHVGIAHSAALLADLLEDADRHPEAAARMQHAVRESRIAETPMLAVHRLTLGRMLVKAGRSDEAADELATLIEEAVADQAPPQFTAHARFWHGHASRTIGMNADAHEAWGAATADYVAAEDFAGAANVGTLHAQLMADFWDDDAIAVADAALGHARATGRPESVVDALHTAGRVKGQFEDEDAMGHLAEAEQLARELGAAGMLADVLDAQVLTLRNLERPEEMLQAAVRAAEAYRAIGNPVAAALNDYTASRVLHDTGRDDEAAVLLADAMAAVVDIPNYLAPVAFQYGDVLEKLGRHPEAAEVRARAEAAAQQG